MDELRDQFLIEGRELVQQAASDLLALERSPEDTNLIGRVFRAVHTLKGASALFDVAPLTSVVHAAEDMLDALRRGKVTADRASIGVLIGVIVQVERWLDDFEAGGKLPADAVDQGRALQAALQRPAAGFVPNTEATVAPAESEWVRRLASAYDGPREALTAIRYAPHRDCFFRGDDPLQIVRAVPELRRLDIVPQEAWGGGDTFDPFACNLIFLGLSAASRESIEAVFRLVSDQVELIELGERGGEGANGSRSVARTLRVPAARLDSLAEIVDELLLAKNEISYLFRQLDDRVDSTVSRRLASGRMALDHLVARLHRTVVDLRLVPLTPLLRRFPALAREIGDGLGKPLDVVVRGDSLEVDKSIVDGLFEPLVHLVRNAVDHGIETADVRRAAGKAEIGTITIEARRVGDALVIDVSDDGKGIDADQLRQTAETRLGLSQNLLASLNERETLELVFRPGFSTAASINEVSGRGVGMDAVRSAIGVLGGQVSLTSAIGTGTTVKLILPFRTVLTRVVTIEAGLERFGVPIDSIVETVRVEPEQIQPVRHGRVFIWRDKVVPLLDLSVLLGSPRNFPGSQGLSAMIVGEGDRLAAIAVDKFSDRLDVSMRPLEGSLHGIKGIAGTALSGDGSVLLVLNPVELVG